MARGKVIAFLDADDYYAKNKLKQQVNYIRNGADIVYSDAYEVCGQEKEYRESFDTPINEKFYIEFFRYDGAKGNIPTSTIAVHQSVLGDQRFKEQLNGGEDYHLWVRLFETANRIERIPDPLTYVRQRDESLSSDADMMYENRLQAIELLCDRYPELRPYRQERELQERYDYARHLMFDGRIAEARSIFLELLSQERYVRAAPLLGVSLLPFSHERIVGVLDDLYARVR